MVGTMTVISLARAESCRRPFRFIGAVGIFLCFEAYACTLVIYCITFAFDCAVKEVAGINLYAGLVGIYMKQYAVCRIVKFYRCQIIVAGRVENPVVVVTVAVANLLVEFRQRGQSRLLSYRSNLPEYNCRRQQ